MARLPVAALTASHRGPPATRAVVNDTTARSGLQQPTEGGAPRSRRTGSTSRVLVASRNCPLTANACTTVASTQAGGVKHVSRRTAPVTAWRQTRARWRRTTFRLVSLGRAASGTLATASTRRPRRANRSGRSPGVGPHTSPDTGGPALCVEWTNSCARNRCYTTGAVVVRDLVARLWVASRDQMCRYSAVSSVPGSRDDGAGPDR